jgi:uncharacterized membrane protein YeiH
MSGLSRAAIGLVSLNQRAQVRGHHESRSPRSTGAELAALPARLRVTPLHQRGVDELWAVAGIAFRYFDVGATFLWAASGAVLAARRGYDLTGIFAIALVSSCGGGLLRDALFLQAGPPALVRTPTYVIAAMLASLLTWRLGERLRGRLPSLFVRLTALADAIGLGAFAVVGMRLALAASINWAGAVLVGVVNAVGGGVLRSVLINRTPEVFRPGQLTAIAALGGSLVYGVLTLGLHLAENIAGAVAIVLVAGTNWVSRRYSVQTRAAWSVQARRRRDSLSVRSGSGRHPRPKH